ncbi:MAG: tetratricopeptide repeat protein, partial [Candidatus Poribacteria bacterium]|nr:tetratricopeptide repeat protein [Candidatus Poribacteria bacterium]
MVETTDFENFDTGAENSGLEDLTPDSSSVDPVVEENNAAALVTTEDGEITRLMVPFVAKTPDDLADTVSVNKQVARQNIDDPVAFYNLGSAYFYQKAYRQAITCFKRAIKLKSDYDRAYNNLGAVYDQLGREYQAFNAYRKALHFNPDLADAHYNVGRMYEKRK